jgi:HPt (histidine-containing phosphotransfer) domain-containing protein
MNDYVSKPIKETLLYNMIARHAQHISHPQSNSFINLDYLQQLSGNDPVFEKEILQQFLIQMPAELGLLKEHIQSNDFDNIRRVAHSLKSTVGYVGLASELHPQLDQIEQDAISEDNRHFFQNFSYVKDKCDQAAEEVKSLLAKDFI